MDGSEDEDAQPLVVIQNEARINKNALLTLYHFHHLKDSRDSSILTERWCNHP